MGTKKKKSSSGLFTFLAIAFVLILIIVISNSGVPGKKITYTEAQTIIQNGQATHLYVQSNGTALIRKSGSEILVENFPESADYNFEFISTTALVEFVDEYNENVKAYGRGDTSVGEFYKDKSIIYVTYKVPSASFIETITPYISIVVMVIIGFLLFKMFSSKGGGVGAFNKSRAKLVEKSTIRFKDVAGADEEKEEVQEIVEFLKNPQKFKNLGARIPKGVLLVGPPGTGKTLLAKAVAGESNVPFLSITGSDFVELYVGVGAGRVRDLFETAKKCAPCIVFIDEIDAVGRQRGAGLGGGNDEREQTLNQLLTEMDGFEANDGVIVLAATNRADVLDPALLRPGRFDRQIYVNAPDVRGREGILEIYAKNKPMASDVDLKVVARLTSGFTGADIENCLNEAAILAARNNKLSITMADITEGINKVLMGPQKKSRIVTEEDKKITAYHEAGHAILAKKLNYGDEVHEVSIIPRGMAAGYTSTRPSDDTSHYTKKKLHNRICMIMGGRIAEELCFDDISAGASNDIARATEIARKMVAEWGMSDKLGFLNYGGEKDVVFIGRDYQQTKNYSEQTAGIIDSEIKEIIDYNYKRGVQILKENRTILDNFAKLLLDKETIYSKEVDMILSGMDPIEVAKQIDIEIAERKKQEELMRKESEKQQQLKLQLLKEQTAEALSNAGVISKEELDAIKSQGKKLEQELEEVRNVASEEKRILTEEEHKELSDKNMKREMSIPNSEESKKSATAPKKVAKKPATTKKSTKNTKSNDKEDK